jgi:hypothetical protein
MALNIGFKVFTSLMMKMSVTPYSVFKHVVEGRTLQKGIVQICQSPVGNLQTDLLL